MEGQCNYFVARKKRLCRMTVRTGAKYCGEHELKTLDVTVEESQQNAGRLRMACPLDPKHTCYFNKLEKHLKICNAKQDTFPPYIKKGCNMSDSSNKETDVDNDVRRSLANVPSVALAEVVDLIEKIYEDLVHDKLSSYDLSQPHACVKQELENAERGDNTKRNLLQTSAIITIVESEKLVNENTCFVELGAGKGQVSFYLASVVNQVVGCSVLLVDRASHRHKLDNRLDSGSHRVRADISDLLISEVPVVSSSQKIVGVAKHLCGVATDLAFRCVTQSEILEKTEGLVMATCCHHRCYWKSYVGREFLENLGITYSKFNIICGLVSWATCGSGLSRERRAQINQKNNDDAKQPKKPKYDDEDHAINASSEMTDDKNLLESTVENSDSLDRDGENVVIAENNKSVEKEHSIDIESSNDNKNEAIHGVDIKSSNNLGLSLKQRAVIGCKAKLILDWGRVLYLRKRNFKAKLCFYVDKNISPENVCIIATKNRDSATEGSDK